MPQTHNEEPLSEINGPLAPGVRVSLELPDAGTCVAVVKSQHDTTIMLELLDEVLEGELQEGSHVDLFVPRNEGIYHWPCALSGAPQGQQVEVQLLNLPMFVQRRLGRRLEAALQAQVRRIYAARRGRQYETVVADLSHGGLKLQGAAHLGTGDTVEVTMDLGGPVVVVGRVVMSYPTGPGSWAVHLSFLEGQPDATELVDAFISRQLRQRATSASI